MNKKVSETMLKIDLAYDLFSLTIMIIAVVIIYKARLIDNISTDKFSEYANKIELRMILKYLNKSKK